MSKRDDLLSRISHLSPAKQALLEKWKRGEVQTQKRVMGKRPNQDTAPSSFAQQRLWFIDQLAPGNPAYNIPISLVLTGCLNIVALHQALNEVVQRHEVLRTTFSIVDGQAVQAIAPSLILNLPLVDLQQISADEQHAHVLELAKKEALEPFDLCKGPLLRANLLRLSVDNHVLLLTMHHIVSDGWSMGVLIREMGMLYEAFADGKPYPLPELAIQYADFAVWQREWLQGEVLQTQLSYWQQQLGGNLPILELPSDRLRPAVQTFQGQRYPFALSQALTEALMSVSQQSGVTLFMTLLAAYQTLLYRYSGQEDICVGSPIANRNRAEIEGLIGLFVNTLVLRTDLSGNPSFRQLLQRVREVTLGAYAHQDLPFEKLVEELQPERSLSHNPLFQVMFILQNTPMSTLELEGLTLNPLEIDHGTAQLDLTLNLQQTASGISGWFEYNSDLFEAATIGRIAQHLQTLLESIVADLDQQLDNITLLTAIEQKLLLVDGNASQTTYPQDECIHTLFEQQVRRTPQAIAVEFANEQLTYKKLNQRANQLAHHLQQLGVGPDSLVGICVERSLDMIVSLLSILKAGGAYIPLDPAYPQERLAYMITDSQLPVLLTQEHLLATLPKHTAQVVCLDTDWQTIAQASSDNPDSAVTAENLAYIIYTSGSIGKPKGVEISHQSVVNFLLSMQQQPGLTTQDVLLAVTSICFDIAGLEIYLPLTVGARICLVSREVAADGRQLLDSLNKSQATFMQATPATWRMLLTVGWRGSFQLKILCGGEALTRELANQLLDKCSSLWNMYGPTETTIWSAVYQVQPGDRTVSIGKPIANTQIYLLRGQELQPVPIGVPGELYIGGAGLARGYFQRPELTAQRFIANPFSKELASKLYQTGDLARYLPDGNIECLGRLDHQVKIRGFRIELGEIEALLTQHPGVRENVVVAREDVAGEKSLVAYVVPQPEQAPTPGELRLFLKEKLPEYMIPSAFVTLVSLPLTPNGKVDRKALPAPNFTRSDLEVNFVPPRTDVEEILAGIWADVLRVERVGVHDNFFELGGHSLLLTQLLSQVREKFHIDIPLRYLFEAPTVAESAHHIEVAIRAGQPLQRLPIERVSRSQELPLSFMQQRLWLFDQLEPSSCLYNMPAAVRLRGRFDVVALEQSLHEVVRRHEVLRTTFVTVDGQPIQVITPNLNLKLSVVNLEDLPETEQERVTKGLMQAEAQTPFDLAQGPLLRTTLLKLGETEHVLLLTIHHIVSDGWSIGVFVRELSRLYAAFVAGEPSPLAELLLQYADFAHWQQQWLQGEVLESELSYWKQQLGDHPPVLQLPTDYPRSPVQTFRGAKQSLILPQSLTKSLKALSLRSRVTLFMTLLTAFKILLYRYTGQDKIIVGSAIAGREQAEIRQLIGLFVNTLVLHTDLSGNPSFSDLLRRVREVTLGAYAHQNIPFEKLVAQIQPERNLSHNPLFQVFFNMLNFADQRIDLPDLSVEMLSPLKVASKFDLTLYVQEENAGIQLELVYNAELFTAQRMVEMLEQLQHLLWQIVDTPQTSITDVSLLTPAAKVSLPNPEQTLDLKWEGAVHQWFSQQAQRVPEHLAIVDNQGAWTYQEIDTLSNQLANYLLASGIQSEDIVAIYGHRSASLIWAILGVLKAGAAFVILDANYPPARLINCLQVAKAQGWLQLTAAGTLPEALAELVTATTFCCRLELPHTKVCEALMNYGTQNPHLAIHADDLAYVAFTSGSTGIPKGILGSHRPLSHFLLWQRQTFGLHQCDRFSMLSGLSHDPLLRDIFAPLSLGATLYIPNSEEMGNPGWLAQWMQQQQISITHLTPAMAQLLTQTTDTIPSWRYAFFGGDVLTKRLVSRLRELADSITCVNFYGATETPQAMGYFIASQDDDLANVKEILPLGQGIADVQLLVLNVAGQLAGVGEIGEIYVRTPYLAKGYMGDDSLTQKRFIVNPLTNAPEDRLYRTGDLGRYLPDGKVEFLGRQDHQVKIRGFRIELGEIEAVLSQYPAVQETVVILREDIPDDKRLVAYVVLKPEQEQENVQLKSFLEEKLPSYMMPSALVVLESLPLTPNGKVDRQALPAHDLLQSDFQKTFVAPCNPVEEVLAGIWAETLGIEQVGIYDNFFQLGGHSLLATQLLSRIRNTFQVELSLRSVFGSPTVAGLAAALIEDPDDHIQVEKTAELLLMLSELSDDETKTMLNEQTLLLQQEEG